ncbi:MAG: methyltransferase domain-containing protein [Anaerolineaceae bacterium]|nr:methyltransferase domain-containing protein [Anaerolineaceae bacterium]
MAKFEPISRVTRTKEQARATYNALSGWYDLLAGMAEKKYKMLGIHALALQTGEQVLEIGFGTGQCLLPIANTIGKTGKLYGIDLSDGMLNVTSKKIKRAGLQDQVELRCGDAVHLPYPDNMFDAVYSSFTLELFDTPEIPLVLAECQRVLKPNGRFGIVSMVQVVNPGWMVKLYEWSHEKFPAAVDCRPIDAQAFIEDAGFRIISLEEQSMFGLPLQIVCAVKSEY